MSRSRRNLFLAFMLISIVISRSQLSGQQDPGWRISPKNINILAGADRALQLLDDSAQELHGAEWFVNDSTLADVREEEGRVVVHAKAAGTVRIGATLHGENRFREITIWPADQPLPLGTTTWGTQAIGREIGDIAAVPKPGGPNIFSLEQTANGNTYLRAVSDDGIQIWTWLMPEKTRDVELVCGDWLGGALISANRSDAYTLYTVGGDGKLRWQYTHAGLRKAHAYNLEHLVHLLSQSADGLATTVTGLDEVTGEQKFELTVPASHQEVINVRMAGKKILCGSKSVTSPIRTIASKLFVNSDGLAYMAFTQNEWTLATTACTPGSVIEPRNVSFARDERVVLWQIHADGTYRSTIVEQSKGSRPLSVPVSAASPTGSLIPDGLGGVLLSIRRSHNNIVDDVHRPPDEFVFRVNQDGEILYSLLLPRYDGKLHDEMVLGENNLGFTTRGGTLTAFDVLNGKEVWHWNSPREIEVFAALANGGCLVQTPTAVVEVENATTSKEIFEGKAIMDWQGHIYREHD